jgi:hypothetical protein
MGSGLVRGVPLRGDSGSGIRDGVTSRSRRCSYGLAVRDLDAVDSCRYDLRYHLLLWFCQAGGAHGPSDSASDSSSCGGALQRDECMVECALYAELCMLRSGSKSLRDALRDISE